MVTQNIRTRDIEAWLYRGRIDKLEEHWDHPKMVAFREAQSNDLITAYDSSTTNTWIHSIDNGATLVFLLKKDSFVASCYPDLDNVEKWAHVFFKMRRSSWDLLDIAPQALRCGNAVSTLSALVDIAALPAVKQRYGPDQMFAKLWDELRSFYTRFKHHQALTALSWYDHPDLLWNQASTTKNLIRQSMKNNPKDVLGMYLMLAFPCARSLTDVCNADDEFNTQKHMQRIISHAGLDASVFSEHARNFKSMYNALGIAITTQHVLDYIQTVYAPACSLSVDHNIFEESINVY